MFALTLPAWLSIAFVVVEYIIKIVAIGVVPENRRPSSSQAEFCMFLDAALAVTIVILTLRSMILLVGETPSAGKVDHARTFHQVPARVAGKSRPMATSCPRRSPRWRSECFTILRDRNLT